MDGSRYSVLIEKGQLLKLNVGNVHSFELKDDNKDWKTL